MPQKPLKAGKKIEKKKAAANNHGKGSVTRKGKLEKPPKKAKDLELYLENKELSKVINKTNESNFATIAQGKGGRLKTLKGPPPALAPKDKIVKAKAAKKAHEEEEGNKMDEEEEEEDME